MAKELKEVKKNEKVMTVPAKVITFEKWFTQSKRPSHHKAGMAAFTNIKVLRTVEQWNEIFKKY